ncbi:MAG: hypothetical protein EOL97_09575 [Spirochaetia bacterium]|nr:hypothetical protein [Spirochaetia bacterium]
MAIRLEDNGWDNEPVTDSDINDTFEYLNNNINSNSNRINLTDSVIGQNVNAINSLRALSGLGNLTYDGAYYNDDSVTLTQTNTGQINYSSFISGYSSKLGQYLSEDNRYLYLTYSDGTYYRLIKIDLTSLTFSYTELGYIAIADIVPTTVVTPPTPSGTLSSSSQVLSPLFYTHDGNLLQYRVIRYIDDKGAYEKGFLYTRTRVYSTAGVLDTDHEELDYSDGGYYYTEVKFTSESMWYCYQNGSSVTKVYQPAGYITEQSDENVRLYAGHLYINYTTSISSGFSTVNYTSGYYQMSADFISTVVNGDLYYAVKSDERANDSNGYNVSWNLKKVVLSTGATSTLKNVSTSSNVGKNYYYLYNYNFHSGIFIVSYRLRSQDSSPDYYSYYTYIYDINNVSEVMDYIGEIDGYSQKVITYMPEGIEIKRTTYNGSTTTYGYESYDLTTETLSTIEGLSSFSFNPMNFILEDGSTNRYFNLTTSGIVMPHLTNSVASGSISVTLNNIYDLFLSANTLMNSVFRNIGYEIDVALTTTSGSETINIGEWTEISDDVSELTFSLTSDMLQVPTQDLDWFFVLFNEASFLLMISISPGLVCVHI